MTSVLIVTPVPLDSKRGNSITARRWGEMLSESGFEVKVAREFRDEAADVLVTLHASKSLDVIQAWRQRRGDAPVVLAMTGTDLYRDLPDSKQALASLDLADYLVVLQSLAFRRLPVHVHGKVHVILQSANSRSAVHKGHGLQVCCLGHLRDEKDALRVAHAARLLPEESEVRVVLAGAALDAKHGAEARQEEQDNPRFCWLGELPEDAAQVVLAESRILVVPSKMEGGANVISEALACDVPVLASRIDGNVGMLGSSYDGYFEVGDTKALAELISKFETDAAFRERLQEQCRGLAPLFSRKREQAAWSSLISSITS